MKPFFKVAAFSSVVAFLLSACVMGLDGRRGVSSSLVDYLYPDGEVPPKHEQTVPHLRLPLTVGLAFVPSERGSSSTLPEAKKAELLEQVKQKFVGLDYVKEITVIPETYMRSSKGFKGVSQIARLYSLDVVALVSYDQVTVTAETKSSMLYWTIVGAYFIQGSNNQATTFVDTAVFDVHSRKMLFRAPGVSEVEKTSTLVGMDQKIRETREKGFELAMADMSNNLVMELGRFKAKIKEDNSVEITHRKGYGGGGGFQWPVLMVLFSMMVLRTIKK